jgi:hypothetical protein
VRLPSVRSALAAADDRGCIRSQRAISQKESDMKARMTLITTLAAGIAALAPAMASASHYLPQGADSTTTQQVRPDDRAGARAASTRPDDRAGYRGPSAPITASVAQVSNGFDWRDAFIGGVSGIGIALLLMGGLLLVTSRRTRAARIA